LRRLAEAWALECGGSPPSVQAWTDKLSHSKIPQPDTAPKDLLFLGGSFFLIFMGAATLQQFAIPYLKEVRGWSEQKCYRILPTVYFCFAFWRVNVANIIRRIGNPASLTLGGFSYCLFAAALLLSPSYPLLLAALMAWGIGAALLSPGWLLH